MSISLVQIVACLAMLYVGGEWLVRGASALAVRTGISTLAVGLTVVAFGTSAPELVVSLDAAISGASDVSLGNVVGSNIANVALILGLAALVRPIAVHARIVRVDAPLMVGASIALLAILANGRATRLEGIVLLLGLLAYVATTFASARRESRSVRAELASVAPAPVEHVSIGFVHVALGLLLLVAGGQLLVDAAINLATLAGIGQAAIGLTIVAVGTSLPEFVTSVVASLRGHGDIAIGNVVGSNIFNILGIFGFTAALRPLSLGNITGFDLGIMLGLAVALTITVAVRGRLGRAEGGVLVAIFVGYTAWLLIA